MFAYACDSQMLKRVAGGVAPRWGVPRGRGVVRGPCDSPQPATLEMPSEIANRERRIHILHKVLGEARLKKQPFADRLFRRIKMFSSGHRLGPGLSSAAR